MAQRPRFYLIDGHALAYRTYYALTRAGHASRWTTKAGAPPQDIAVTILTGDRDLLQLASDRITIRLAGQKLSEALDYGPADVRHKLGIEPHQLVDYKARVGDTSDNIPGVSGIGEKTAVAPLGEV